MFRSLFLNFFFFLFAFPFWTSAEKNIVIIKNKASSSSTQVQPITATVLTESPTKKIRKARERQEIETEDKILKELEKQRLIDEQKRLDRLFGHSEKPKLETPVKQHKRQAFSSLGAGIVSFPNITNMDSMSKPAFFISFGSYLENNLLFDFLISLSEHYTTTPYSSFREVRQKLSQMNYMLAIKMALLEGPVKPYVGVSVSGIHRKWFFVNKDRNGLDYQEEKYKKLKDIDEKRSSLSLDVGPNFGLDILFPKTNFGLNIDLRYHVNLKTEQSLGSWSCKPIETESQQSDCNKRDSFIYSVSLKYYF